MVVCPSLLLLLLFTCLLFCTLNPSLPVLDEARPDDADGDKDDDDGGQGVYQKSQSLAEAPRVGALLVRIGKGLKERKGEKRKKQA